MPKKENLKKAQLGKNDEFYTQFVDIQREVNAYLEYNPDVFRNKTILLPCDDPEWSNFTKFFAQNFQNFGLKKLISTSYANDKKNDVMVQLSLFESESPKYDKKKTNSHGKIFILDGDDNHSGNINIDDLKWDYLDGDGDFRSDEVKKLRDESDIIITNPPFSLFREFVDWIMEGKKQFLIIGNINAISYKEVFPLIQENKMWTGNRFNQRINGKNMTFLVPDSYELKGTELYTDEKGKKYTLPEFSLYKIDKNDPITKQIGDFFGQSITLAIVFIFKNIIPIAIILLFAFVLMVLRSLNKL